MGYLGHGPMGNRETLLSNGSDASLGHEDLARASSYALIARLLLRAPAAPLVERIAGTHRASPSRPTRLQAAWHELAAAAARLGPEGARREYEALFEWCDAPRVPLHASLYLRGSMSEGPVAALRIELAGLGLTPRPDACEPEDHLGALCEAMAFLIAAPEPTRRKGAVLQRGFFERRIAQWYRQALHDLREAEGADFYRRLADFACAFLDADAEALKAQAGAAAG